MALGDGAPVKTGRGSTPHSCPDAAGTTSLKRRMASMCACGEGRPAFIVFTPRCVAPSSCHAPTQPDRNGALYRQRIDARRLNVMPAAVEGHRFLREEGAQHGNLLLTALATIPEVFVQRLVFDRIPPDADAEAEPSPAQDVDLRRLLGDQDGLALREDQDAGDKLQTLREAREVPKQHQRLMEEAAIGVRATPVTVMRGVGPDDMIEGQKVRVAERLRRLRIVPDRDRVCGDLRLWKDDANTHVLPSSVGIGISSTPVVGEPMVTSPPTYMRLHDTCAHMCRG